MSLLKSFLPSIRESLKSAKLGSKVTIVSGNQSADLDSVCSSICYAFLKHKNDNSLVIPLLNIPRDDLKLRGDVEHVLEKSQICPTTLFFSDDLPNLPKDPSYELILVDHNQLQGEALQQFVKERKVKVVGIIDHHEDENDYLDADPRIIEKSGSCISLVANYWSKSLSNDDFKMGLGNLILPPILIDTTKLTKKVENSDLEAISFLKSKDSTVTDDSIQTIFSTTIAKKTDVSKLSVFDLLRKDYKEYDLVTSKGDKLRVGMSSVVKSLETLPTSEEIEKALQKWSVERSLSIAVIMTAFTGDNDDFKRELCLYSINDGDYKDSLIDGIKEELKLVKLDTISQNSDKLKAFNQLNTEASRKQVAPLIKNFVESH